MMLIGDFLIGSLLTLLLPVFLLIALVAWYMLFLRKVPEPAEGRGAAPATRPGQATDVAVPDQGPGVTVSPEVNRLPDSDERAQPSGP